MGFSLWQRAQVRIVADIWTTFEIGCGLTSAP